MLTFTINIHWDTFKINQGEKNVTKSLLYTISYLLWSEYFSWCIFALKIAWFYSVLSNVLSPHRYVFTTQLNRVWAVCLKDWLFVYEVSGCGFKYCCSHFNSDIAPLSQSVNHTE